MKIKIGVLMVLAGALFFSSCNNNKTYAEMKKDQKKAIEQFITEKNIEVIHKYPTDSIFGENQFLLLDNGIYLNIVDSGNGNRAIQYKTKILMRCSGEFIYAPDTTFSIFTNGNEPIEFIYGYASTTISERAPLYTTYRIADPVCMFLSPGVESILGYVGENAVVKLLVPFDGKLSNGMSAGSTYQTSNNLGAPLYYDKLRFQFY